MGGRPRSLSDWRIITAGFSGTILLIYLYLSSNTTTTWVTATHAPRLHILVPATEGSGELCKLVVSAGVLGYPSPILVNWNRTTDYYRTDWRANGTHIDKLVGVSRYLDAHAASLGTDRILVIDGYDTWFQLPSSVLLERFDRVNARNTEYIAEIIGEPTATREDLRQRIIFPAQKACGPKDSGKLDNDEPGCYAVPPSPLPSDLYGPRTDIHDSKFPWRVRPHWLNSGLIMGAASDMRAMYTSARELVDTFFHGGSDQLIFSKMLGEQWYQRHVMSEGEAMLSSTSIPAALASSLPNSESLQTMPRLKGKPLEFGIGLDYAMEISQTQVYSEFNAKFLVYNDSQSLAEQQALTPREKKMGYGMSAPRVTALDDDMAGLPTPFSALSRRGELDGTLDSWNQVPLYTNTYVGHIPATIHMNGMKYMRQELWPRMWYHDRLPELLQAEMQQRQVGAFTEQGIFMPWDELCGDVEDIVFGAG